MGTYHCGDPINRTVLFEGLHWGAHFGKLPYMHSPVVA